MLYIQALLWGLLFYLSLGADSPCNPRQGAEGQGQICVCNSTYCDTIERPPRLYKGKYHWYSTSNSTPGFSHTIGNFTSLKKYADTVIEINSSVQYQKILGFGGSFTDTVGIVLNYLPVGARDRLMKSYFGPDGIEYSMARVPIGASDFSPRPYTLDDVPNDAELKYFNLTEEDYNYKIPFIKQAMSMSQRGIKFLGCSWACPSWMKVNGNRGRGYLKAEYYQSWAKYHLKFLQAYEENNISFWGISGGNEVILAALLPKGLMNSTLMLATNQRHWFKSFLSPLLKSSGFTDVKLLAFEDTRLFANYWMDRFAVDPEAFEILDGIALHWYFDMFIPVTTLNHIHEKYPDKMILYTESSIQMKPLLGSWNRAERYIFNVIENFNNWTECYIDWNLALDPEGGPTMGLNLDSAIIVNQTSGEFYKQPFFYALGHFSKFMPPGSRRILLVSSQNNTTKSDESIDLKPIERILSSYDHMSSLAHNLHFVPPHYISPSVVEGIASANHDGSYTVIVVNSLNVTAHVRIDDPNVGSINVHIEKQSINSFIYWL